MNVAYEYEKLTNDEKKQKIRKVLDKVGINKELNTKIYTLSGGEQQRVAIACTLLKNQN